MTYIDDIYLLEKFLKNIKRDSFITESENKEKIKNNVIMLINNLKKEDTEHDLSRQDFKTIKELWGHLLETSLFFLKINDSREAGIHDKEVYGVKELNDYYDDFKKHEKILYGTKNRYRDHIFHMVRVYMLGDLLIRRFKGGYGKIELFDYEVLEKNCKKENKSEIEKAISSNNIEAMWCIIALTHDLGIPLENCYHINEPMRKILKYYGRLSINEFNINFPAQSRFIDDFIIRFISSKVDYINNQDYEDQFLTTVQTKYYLKFSKEFEEYKHGIISCVFLMKNLTYFLESDYVLSSGKTLDCKDAIQFIIRREILRAIATHTCDEIYHLKINNLPFLLVIVDEMQTWGRPLLDEYINEEKKKNMKLKIWKFSERKIFFEIIWDDDDIIGAEDDIKKFAYHLFNKKFNKILRSGVDTGERKFSFQCKLTVKINNVSHSLSYTHEIAQNDPEKSFIIGKVTYQKDNGGEKIIEDIESLELE